MKEFNWRESINSRLTYRLEGYIREVKHIKEVVGKSPPNEITPEWLQIELAKQRWF